MPKVKFAARAFVLGIFVLSFTACGKYGGREQVPVRDAGSATAYLIDRTDWVLRVREELLDRNLSRPSDGQRIRFNGQPVYVRSGAKILAWRCDGEWDYDEVYFDSSKNFKPKPVSTLCQG